MVYYHLIYRESLHDILINSVNLSLLFIIFHHKSFLDLQIILIYSFFLKKHIHINWQNASKTGTLCKVQIGMLTNNIRCAQSGVLWWLKIIRNIVARLECRADKDRTGLPFNWREGKAKGMVSINPTRTGHCPCCP
jgi:hypothetical protein